MLWLVWNMEIWKYDEIRVFQSYQGWFPLTICQGSWKQRIQCFPFSNVFSTYDMNLMWSFAIMWSASMPSNPFFNLFPSMFPRITGYWNIWNIWNIKTRTSSPDRLQKLRCSSYVAQDGSTMQLLQVSHRVLQQWIVFLAMSFATFWGDEHP